MIVIGGENLIDFIQVEDNSPTMTYTANPGGSPYNCAKALGRQGVATGYITPISIDSLGALLANTLTSSDVTLLSPRVQEPTSLAVVSLESGVPSYQFYRENTAERRVTPEALNHATPDSMQALCLGSLALTAGEDADIWADYFCAIKAKGIFTALDPNIRAAFIRDRPKFIERLNRVMAHTDLLKLSDEDLEWLMPDLPIEAAARQLAAQSAAKLLVVTLGSKGAFALSNGSKTSVPPSPVRTMHDTVGAGDTFMATLLSRLDKLGALSPSALGALDQSSIEILLSWAATAAALNCEKEGCDPPSLAELESRMSP